MSRQCREKDVGWEGGTPLPKQRRSLLDQGYFTEGTTRSQSDCTKLKS